MRILFADIHDENQVMHTDATLTTSGTPSLNVCSAVIPVLHQSDEVECNYKESNEDTQFERECESEWTGGYDTGEQQEITERGSLSSISDGLTNTDEQKYKEYKHLGSPNSPPTDELEKRCPEITRSNNLPPIHRNEMTHCKDSTRPMFEAYGEDGYLFPKEYSHSTKSSKKKSADASEMMLVPLDLSVEKNTHTSQDMNNHRVTTSTTELAKHRQSFSHTTNCYSEITSTPLDVSVEHSGYKSHNGVDNHRNSVWNIQGVKQTLSHTTKSSEPMLVPLDLSVVKRGGESQGGNHGNSMTISEKIQKQKDGFVNSVKPVETHTTLVNEHSQASGDEISPDLQHASEQLDSVVVSHCNNESDSVRNEESRYFKNRMKQQMAHGKKTGCKS